MVKIYYDVDTKSTLFSDKGIYRFALDIEDVEKIYVDYLVNEIQKVVFESGGRGLKSRKSKGKVNFSFTAENGGIAEDGFKSAVELLKQWRAGQPAKKTQDVTAVAMPVADVYGFKKGDEFVWRDTLSNDIIVQATYYITKVEDSVVEWDTYHTNGMKLSEKEGVKVFQGLIENGNILILPEVKQMLSDGDYVYVKDDLYKFKVSQGGDMDFSVRTSTSNIEHINTNIKTLSPKLISYLLDSGRWQKLTINVGDEFKNRYKQGFGTDKISILKIDANEVVEFSEEKVGLDPDIAYGHISVLKDSLWMTNAIKVVDAQKIIALNQKSAGMNELEKKLMELKEENKNLVQLREAISEVNFEDRFNVNAMIKDNQKEINKINGELLEIKIGGDNFFDALFEQSFKPILNRYDSKISKNQEENFIAPNGDVSDLPQELQSVVNSRDFIEWFGDWKTAYMYRNLPDFGGENISKAVSDKFEPLLVWHGTGKQFSYFKFDKFPANYFAVNKQYSDFFAQMQSEDGVGYVIPFFINVKNPLDLTLFGNDLVEPQEFWDWIYLQTGKTPEELEVTPIFTDKTMRAIPVWVYIRNNPKMLVNIAQNTNYDSIVFDEFNPNIKDVNSPAYATRAYIVFDPHQVKIADPERGDILLTELKSFMLKRGGKI